MLTGRLPYEGDSPVSVAIQHINSVPLSPRELNPDIPEALEAITMKAMASSLERRYINADAMLADLEEFRKNPNMNIDYTPAMAICDDEPTQVIGREKQPYRSAPSREESKAAEDEYDDYDTPRGKGRRKAGVNPYFVGAIVAVFVFLFGIGYMLWANVFSDLFATAQEHTVPKLVQLKYEDVIGDSQYQEFNITLQEYQPSETVEEGYIIQQTPEADSVVKGDKPEIKVVVSSGADYVILESYVNQEYRSVLSKLMDLGLRPRAEEINNETITPNYVVSTSPAEGSALNKGDEVIVYYSKGPAVQPVTMIQFVGMTIEQVEAKLAIMDLKMGTTVPVDSDEPKGTIVDQSVPVSEQVPAGTSINFQVSRGPKDTPTPSTAPSDEPSQKVIPVTLPSGDGTVRVRITLDGEIAYEQEISMSGTTMSIPVTGKGTQEAAVYFDGQLQTSYKVDFSA